MGRLIALLTLGLLLAACQPQTASAPQQPSSTIAPSAGPSLIWLEGDSTPVVHPLIDWSGTERGSVRVEGSVLPSPDGRIALVDFNHVVDSRGKNIGAISLPRSEIRDAIWADDSKHLCLLGEPTSASPEYGARALWLTEPGKSPRWVAAVGQAGSLAGVTSCSITNDRAVVLSDYGTHLPPPQGNKVLLTSEVQVISLSSGSLLYQHDYSAEPRAILAVSSGDGHYLAENGALTNLATVRDLRDGRTVATLPLGVSVLGLSWDGARLFETAASGSQQAVSIVDRVSNRLVWRQVGDGSSFLPRPETSDLLVSTLQSSAPPSLTLVPSTGPVVNFQTGGSLLSACPCYGAGSGA